MTKLVKTVKDYTLLWDATNPIVLPAGSVVELQWRTAHGYRVKLLKDTYPQVKGRDRSIWVGSVMSVTEEEVV